MRAKIYDILEGDSRASAMYGKAMTVLIVASLVPLCFWEENLFFSIVEYVCVAAFIADYIARWSTADIKLKKGASRVQAGAVQQERRLDSFGLRAQA